MTRCRIITRGLTAIAIFCALSLLPNSTVAVCGDGSIEAPSEDCDPGCSNDPNDPGYCAPGDTQDYCNGDPALGTCSSSLDCPIIPNTGDHYDCFACSAACNANGGRQAFCDGDPTGTPCTNSSQCPGSIKCFFALTCCFQNCNTPGTTVSCTDGNDCTVNDQCSNNVCTGDAVPAGTACGDPTDDECRNPDSCDAVGTCLGNDEAPGTTCTDTTADCLDARCDASGACDQTYANEPVGILCGDGTDDDCTDPDTCDGAGSCSDNHEPAGTACPDSTSDCLDARCNGGGECDQAFTFEAPGFACGDATDGDCTNPDTCDGAGSCSDNHEPAGFACTDSTADCLDAQCDGAGACNQGFGFEAPGFACGDASDDDCTNPDTCDGAGSCSDNHEPAGFACTDSTADCLDARCDGSGACDQAAANEPLGFACGDATDDDCTNPDTCDGAGSCSDNHEPAGTACSDTTPPGPGGNCLFSGCDGAGTCDQSHQAEPAGGACGDQTDDVCTNPDVCAAGGICEPNDEALFVGPCRFLVLGEYTFNRKSRGTKFVGGREAVVTGDICTQKARLAKDSSYDGDVILVRTPETRSRYLLKTASGVSVTGDVVTEDLGVRGLSSDGAFGTGEKRILADAVVPMPVGGVIDTTGDHVDVTVCQAAQTDVTDMAATVDTLFETQGAHQDLGKFFVRRGQTATITATVPGGLNLIHARKLGVHRDATLRLDAGGDSDTVFLIRSASRLGVGRAGRIELINGTDPSNVLFYVARGLAMIAREAVGGGAVLAPLGVIHLKRDATWTGAFASRRGLASARGSTLTHAPFLGLQ